MKVFDWRKTALSATTKQQLEKITGDNRAIENRYVLRYLIRSRAFSPEHGYYLPLTSDVERLRMLPLANHKLTADEDRLPKYFSNALLIPNDWANPDFNEYACAYPSNRCAPLGILFVTIEIDPADPITPDKLEEQFAWSRSGKFDELDKRLCVYKDYRGYSLIYSRNKSLHSCFEFSTEHILDLRNERISSEQKSALLQNIHDLYYDKVLETFNEVVKPSKDPDPHMRCYVRWRRTPWAIRRLERDSECLGVPAGTAVPQVVVQEQMRRRAPKGSSEWLVPGSFSLAHPYQPRRGATASNWSFAGDEVLSLVRDMCRAEWGEWPKPASIRGNGVDWKINFFNDERDRNPSTFVIGEFRELRVFSKHLIEKRFFLPDRMNSNDLVIRARLRAGLDLDESSERTPVAPTTEQPVLGRKRKLLFQADQNRMMRHFAIHDSTLDRRHLVSSYRDRLNKIVRHFQDDRSSFIYKSDEGVGKSRIALDGAVDSCVDFNNWTNGRNNCFVFYACRSHEQAEDKKAEYIKRDEDEEFRPRRAVALKSFWAHYREMIHPH